MAAAVCSGTLVGCGDSENFVFTNSPVVPDQPVILASIANNDQVTALGNATLQQAAVTGVLSNDVLNGGEISSFDALSESGATVVLNEDGSFPYTPTFGFTGNDTFQYTLANAAEQLRRNLRRRAL